MGRSKNAQRSKRPRWQRLRVMAEYGSSGIWAVSPDRTGWRHGMVSWSAVGLPQDVADGFRAWIERYEAQLGGDPLDVDAFNARGRELAVALKEVLGAEVEVEFQGEQADGGLLPGVIVQREAAGEAVEPPA